MVIRTRGAARCGVEARLVDVEVESAAGGTSSFRLLGLGRQAAAGMEHRVRAALRNTGVALSPRPITVNVAPAALPKEGPPLDLAVCLALVAADPECPEAEAAQVGHVLLFGELGLDGTVRGVAGALAAAEAARRAGVARVICARTVASEAASVAALEVIGVATVAEALAALRGDGPTPTPRPRLGIDHPATSPNAREAPDLSDVRGQPAARRALEVAAAGGHALLMVGPPGAGKSMLARRLPGLLPALTRNEAIEVTRVHSAAGLLLGSAERSEETGRTGLVTRRPFRAPHHGISAPGLLGGGMTVRPGEISLAHRGVLFLDELPEFRRDVLEGLRQPLEDGRLVVVRASSRAALPSRFQLVAALNPCPCGHHGTASRRCACTPHQVARYRGRISGPLLDRFDLQVEVDPLAYRDLGAMEPSESSASVRERVIAARRRQHARQRCPNAELSPARLRRLVRLDAGAERLLCKAVDRHGLSARAHDRVLRVALTLDDLRRGAAAHSADPEPAEQAEQAEQPKTVARGEPTTLDAAVIGEALTWRLASDAADAPRVLDLPPRADAAELAGGSDAS